MGEQVRRTDSLTACPIDCPIETREDWEILHHAQIFVEFRVNVCA